VHTGDFRFTPNQNVIVARVAEPDRQTIETLAAAHGLDAGQTLRPFQRDAMACVALPTCGLAMAEAERYLPEFLDRVGELLDRHGLGDEPINVRITGCPNGCARPYGSPRFGDFLSAGKGRLGRYKPRMLDAEQPSTAR
jgi:sulfite reductase (NADPH) hemoprotein beta-component